MSLHLQIFVTVSLAVLLVSYVYLVVSRHNARKATRPLPGACHRCGCTCPPSVFVCPHCCAKR
jgi:hypothetical protein